MALSPEHQTAVDAAPPLTDDAMAAVTALMRFAANTDPEDGTT